MDRSQASISLGLIPIRQKQSQNIATASDHENSVWSDMHGWMEKRKREWDEEMALLKNEFFTLKTTTVEDNQRLRRRSVSGGSGSVVGPDDGSCRDRVFRLVLDVGRFEPSEVHVRTQGNSLVVRAKHNEKHENKSVSREFNRRVEIPANVDPKTLKCFIREDGKLLVEAELPPARNESSKDNGDNPSSTVNSFARSFLSDRLSSVGTRSPLRTDLEDTGGQSSLERSGHRSGQEPGRCQPPRGKEMESVASQRTDPNYLEVYSWPNLSKEDIDVLRVESSKAPAERIRYSETEQRNDLLSNHHGDLEAEVPENVQKRTSRIARPKTSAGLYRHNDSRQEGGHFQNTLGRDHLSSTRLWNDLPLENGHSVSTPRVYSDSNRFSVAVDVGNDFEPHELTVKAVDGKLIVHAKLSNSSADRRICNDIYREFDLPGDIEPETLTANLTPEGILILEAPKNDRNCASQRGHFSNDSFFYDS